MINLPLIAISFIVTFLGWNFFYFRNKSNGISDKTTKNSAVLRTLNKHNSPTSKSRDR